MKGILSTVTILFLTKGVYSQNTILDGTYLYQEKTISINDIRNAGLHNIADTSAIGHHIGELYVNRVSMLNYIEEKHDTITFYIIYFIKAFKKELEPYSTLIYTKQDYDKVSYSWLTDSVVSVTLINSLTSNKRSMQLAQPAVDCCLADIKQGVYMDADYEK